MAGRAPRFVFLAAVALAACGAPPDAPPATVSEPAPSVAAPPHADLPIAPPSPPPASVLVAPPPPVLPLGEAVAEARAAHHRIARVEQSDVTVRPHGGLSAEIVGRVVHRHINEPRYCYDHELDAAPDLSGRVSVSWVVDIAGRPTEIAIASSHLRTHAARDGGLAARAVEACLLVAVARWTFPAADDAVVTHVSCPWTFDSDPPDPNASPPPVRPYGMGGLGLSGS